VSVYKEVKVSYDVIVETPVEKIIDSGIITKVIVKKPVQRIMETPVKKIVEVPIQKVVH
jgi:hypothetical protein